MKRLHVSTRTQWRRWLAEHHDRDTNGVWLVFDKRRAGPALRYEEALEEALCFGWIDSVVRRIDDVQYCRKFSPRRPASCWSSANRKRAEKLVKAGVMTQFGLAKIDAAKKSGNWDRDRRPVIGTDIPQLVSEALAGNRKAQDFFATLAPSCRRQYLGWIVTAKRPETRARRLRETIGLLARRQKLGLK